jgi:hypothetical protein
MIITANTQVEKILDLDPGIVRYFILNKVRPFTCGGAYPKTLGDLLATAKVEDAEGFIAGLNAYVAAGMKSS